MKLNEKSQRRNFREVLVLQKAVNKILKNVTGTMFLKGKIWVLYAIVLFNPFVFLFDTILLSCLEINFLENTKK